MPELLPDVWVLRISTYDGYDEAEAERTLELLDPGERERHSAFRREEDRARYRAAHAALRRLAGAYLRQEPASLVFGREDCPLCPEPHGRPSLPGTGLHFSLSHSGDLVLLAFGATAVGADVEELPSAKQADEVASALHSRERAELAALRGDDGARVAAFGRCWTRKEAYLKGTGTGIAVPLDGTYVGAGARPGDVPGWRILDVEAPEGYAAAIAYAV
ncbi:4'-phosphopantetheinyl transferase superfamily protein [Streptomyces sp. NBC_00237]|uniref:4'-phosphopantetheinyl transferase family protein n=1 Tax=Streptomyces sp. NBC_00237 TaxID=2975687 RepID=UPI00224D9370|nr:4'-phosphopantetheinyl transferase superfamily protein [Streptomyces sp. NBC_00237]MCX5206559.1 4'-phosphopantetheinyl transferase superfamily protein [Streptomyces sp. NBC_00237]